MPTEGWITIRANGEIVAHQLRFGQYYCSTMKEGVKTGFNSNSMFCSRTKDDVTIQNADNDKTTAS